jgi:hypothetical protein
VNRNPLSVIRNPLSVIRYPPTDYRSPITVHRSPFTVHRSPITVHQLPFTNYRSPITVHRSPFTVHRSPFTDYRLPTMPEFFNVLPPDQARELLFEQITRVLPAETMATTDALGRITAVPISAPHALPNFRRSTMDGYAVRAADTFGASESLPAFLTVIGEVPMGQGTDLGLHTGQAAIVHTGGMIPDTADAVIQIEHTQVISEHPPLAPRPSPLAPPPTSATKITPPRLISISPAFSTDQGHKRDIF